MMRDFAACGLTMVIDGGGLTMTPEQYAPLYRLWEDEQFDVRTRLYTSAWTRGNE